MLLKPASYTPSKIGSLRSFDGDTERGTKVLRHSYVFGEEAQMSAYIYEQTKHHKQRQCTAQSMHFVTLDLEKHVQHC